VEREKKSPGGREGWEGFMSRKSKRGGGGIG